MIEAVLAESQGRISGPAGAAAKLGLLARTLDSKIKRLKINKYRFKVPQADCPPRPSGPPHSEWLAVRNENLCLIPDNIDNVSAAGVPVAYLTAQMTLRFAGFAKGKTVLSPAIGGSVGNAVTQLANAQGAKHVISTTTNHEKAQQARSLGFDEVIDLSVENLSDGARRITEGQGVDIVIDAVGGEILSEGLGTLAMGGSLTTLGYSAGRKTTIDVTDLIWKRASMKSFSLFAQPAEVWTTAWSVIVPLLQSGAVKPIVAKTFPLAEAADALRYLVEGRPFGRVVLTI